MAEGDDARIDAQNESDIARWAKELGTDKLKIAHAVSKVGPKVGDVRRYLDQQMAGGQADA